MLGLSVTNKRGWMTFKDPTYLISDFTFYEESDQGTPGTEQETTSSGTGGEFVVAGVNAAFGAQNNSAGDLYAEIFKRDTLSGSLTARFKNEATQDAIERYGLIEFDQRAVIAVTARPKESESSAAIGVDDTSSNDNKGSIADEIFGAFSNEGGTILFKDGADIVVKGRNNNHLVSAIAASATLGVLDPLKQSKVEVNATSGVSRIWGWSDSYNGDSPFTVVGEGQNVFDLNFEELPGLYEDYLDNATSSEDDDQVTRADQVLRTAVIAAHGATVKLSDVSNNVEGNKAGRLDIRGDIIASVKDGANAGSNTATSSGYNKGTQANPWYSTENSVTRAEVEVTLQNCESTFVGNVYERHRLKGEAVSKQFDSRESFEAWADYQILEEAKSLGGLVKLSLSNGATWYPIKDWGGWNFDVLFRDDFFIPEPFVTTGQFSVNKGYAYYDDADQYNLQVWNGNGYTTKNNTEKYAEDGPEYEIEDDKKINDLNLVEEGDGSSIPTANLKGSGYETVDNGVYHLYLKGGVVDLFYLRNDFEMSTEQEDLGTAMSVDVVTTQADQGGSEESDPLTGEKRFRIQALSGTDGTIRMFAKNADDHDIVIVDELRGFGNKKLDSEFDLNLVFWNENGTTDLGVDVNDPTTFVHVARVPEGVNVTAKAYGAGRTTYTEFRVEKDTKVGDEYQEGSWTWTQEQDWHKLNDNWYVTSNGVDVPDLAVIGTTVSSANLGYLMATSMETLRDRRGEMRFNGSQEDGWWVRYTHNNFGMDGFDAETDGFQLGYEWEADRDEDGRTMRGIAFDVAQADVDYSSMYGQSEANRYRLSAYQTYLADNGFYYDLIGRAGWYDAETHMGYRREANSTLYEVKGDFDYWAAAASFETGWRMENSSAWWLEPQLQVQYTHIGGYDYTSSQDIYIDADSTDSVIGRLGLRGGKVLTNDAGRRLEAWIGADVLHEFMGDREGAMTGIDHKVDYDVSGEDTWYDGVFGLTWETGDDSRIWAVGKHTFGGEKDNNWTVNVGATWNF